MYGRELLSTAAATILLIIAVSPMIGCASCGPRSRPRADAEVDLPRDADMTETDSADSDPDIYGDIDADREEQEDVGTSDGELPDGDDDGGDMEANPLCEDVDPRSFDREACLESFGPEMFQGVAFYRGGCFLIYACDCEPRCDALFESLEACRETCPWTLTCDDASWNAYLFAAAHSACETEDDCHWATTVHRVLTIKNSCQTPVSSSMGEFEWSYWPELNLDYADARCETDCDFEAGMHNAELACIDGRCGCTGEPSCDSLPWAAWRRSDEP